MDYELGIDKICQTIRERDRHPALCLIIGQPMSNNWTTERAALLLCRCELMSYAFGTVLSSYLQRKDKSLMPESYEASICNLTTVLQLSCLWTEQRRVRGDGQHL